MRHVAWAFALVLLLCGCEAAPETENLDVLTEESGDQVIFATTNCTVPNSDGVRCDEKTCKADQEGDCKEFANACINSDHKYEGTGQEGTCTRVAS
jgi:hypothetical protein